MNILAIETSCDETSIAIIKADGGFAEPKFEILSNVVSSQVEIHAKWGGVVPNLAQREHQKNLIPILKESLEEAGLLEKGGDEIEKKEKTEELLHREEDLLKQFLKFIPDIKIPKIDVIAVTNGPGLEPALWVGVNFAKALSLVWNKPIVATNHLEGHLLSVLLNRKEFSISNFQFPIVALLVSGGHTQLVLIKDWLKYELIGQTRDDAVGEAFDKVARMLGLGYPGGPIISQIAEKHKKELASSQTQLPRPMINSDDFDFSFSGLKTAVLYKTQEIKDMNDDIKAELCTEFQQACIDVLISKTIKAANKYNAKSIVIGGGVASNKELRAQLQNAVQEKTTGCELLIPELDLATDNAAMIGAVAYLHALNKQFVDNIDDLNAHGNLPLS